ncbi:MAG: histidinol dehydrogenase, partial [Candidatus Omnitrophica bacterium]|nr:histidinol dehydrogenase [Candidatus Omnitrophota bacterium]
LLSESVQPIESFGIYIPAGTAPLVSTVYMTIIPAKVAGVKRVVIVTPPDEQGHINPYILAVANLLKVNEIYKVGGAQAIAALAFGTKTIPRVDKIIGPGNMYVTEAKRQLFGYVDIDMLAGPSELAIIANRYSNPEFVFADLEAQMEHLGGLGVLITTSKDLIRQARKRLTQGYVIYAKNLDEAVEIANRIAPEHLQILTNNPMKLAKQVRNAGAIFLGPFSPTALGDYAAGPSHVLPTMGTARFFSGLSVSHFTKTSHVISYSRKALEKLSHAIEKIANLEGLQKHADSIRIRFPQ